MKETESEAVCMLTFSNTFYHYLSRIMNFFFTFLFGSYALVGGFVAAPETPADFTPVVRFAVCSDVHLNGDPDQAAALRLGWLFDDVYAYAEGETYTGLDAVLVVGDFATNGKPEEYELYNEIVDSHIKDGTEMLEVLGNHEFIHYRDEDASVAYDVYKEYVYPEVDRHDVIGGYHFIGVSYDEDGKTFTKKMSWLREQLNAAVKDDPDKPIFVYQHPHPFSTVYGSVNWSDLDVRLVLDNYPQVVDFSGHSHYASSDPRSIWQGSFTAVGTGSLSAYMSNLNYVDGDEDAPGESGGFWIVEEDADGNVRLQLYDISKRCFFDNIDYYLTDLGNTANRPYTWDTRIKLDSPPEFPEGAEAHIEWDSDGNAVLCFPDAVGYYEAENYKISVSDGSLIPIWTDTVVSDYVRAGLTGVRVNIGKLDPGTYTVQITACSPYEREGQTLLTEVTVGDTPVLPGDVNGDGEVTAIDARLALRASVGLEDFSDDPAAFTACDTDRDGVITAMDARRILRASVGFAAIL